MPQTEIRFYQEDNGIVPALEWIKTLKVKHKIGFNKCTQLLQDLNNFGHELTYPTCAPLRDGLYELRAHDRNIHLRILYFFDHRERNVAVIVHGFRKKDKKQQDGEIERGRQRRSIFLESPDQHTYTHEQEGENHANN